MYSHPVSQSLHSGALGAPVYSTRVDHARFEHQPQSSAPVATMSHHALGVAQVQLYDASRAVVQHASIPSHGLVSMVTLSNVTVVGDVGVGVNLNGVSVNIPVPVKVMIEGQELLHDGEHALLRTGLDFMAAGAVTAQWHSEIGQWHFSLSVSGPNGHSAFAAASLHYSVDLYADRQFNAQDCEIYVAATGVNTTYVFSNGAAADAMPPQSAHPDAAVTQAGANIAAQFAPLPAMALTAAQKTEIRQNNTAHLEAYKGALERAKRQDTGSGKTVIEGNHADNRGSAASTFLTWMSKCGHDAETMEEAALEKCVFAYLDMRYKPLDGKASNARVAATSRLKFYVHWQKTKLVMPQQGAIMVMTEDQRRAMQNNTAHLSAYRRALEQATRPDASSGKIVIGPNQERTRGGTASRFLEWMSECGHDAEAMNEAALDDCVVAYLDKRHKLLDGKASNERSQMASSLAAYKLWQKTKQIKPRINREG